MADCQITGCRDLTSGTTFLCDEHWKLVPNRLECKYRQAREDFRHYRSDENYRQMEKAQERCLWVLRNLLKEQKAA